jgi:hypothetical protein
MMGKKGLISVTTITGQLDKPGLKYWANSLGLAGTALKDYFSETAEAGKIVHQNILDMLSGHGASIDVDPFSTIGKHVKKMMDKFKAWLPGKSFHMELCEETLESANGYYGRLDWYGILDGKVTLMDIKSADAPYQENFLQLAGYYMLLRENGHEPEQAIILLVPRDDDLMPVTPVIVPPDMLNTSMEIFSTLVQLNKVSAPLRSYFSRKKAA